MEIKATLNKPYSDKQRADFIVENNHNKGYEIQETENALLAVYNEPLPPSKEDIQELRANAYKTEVDPITCHIQRLGDEEQTAEIIAEIANLVAERKAKVAEIKARYPYPASEELVVEPIETIEEPLVELYSMEI
jgi:hypothetical protein